ncbi:MAG TPA: PAS domain S-box protein [Bryobacteraceae bacterium]|nr:PAS domain S-box protein [Bryobacteraceae bacterium]
MGAPQPLSSEIEIQEQYRLAVDAAGVGTWSVDLLTGEAVLSEVCRKLFGIPPQARPGYDDLLDSVHPDDRERVRAAVERALADGRELNLEHRVVWPDGATHWLNAKGRAYADPAGRLVRMHGVVFDICERKRTEHALEESEARFRLAVETAGLGLWEENLEDGTISAGENVKEMFGFSAPPPGQDAWRARIHPEDLPRLDAGLNVAEAGMGDFREEYRVLHPDGLRWVHSSGTLLRDHQGRPTRVLGLSQDITRRKRAEERLRQSEECHRRIVESTHEGVWVIDSSGITTFANEQMARMLGYEPAEMVGRPLFDFLFPEDVAAAKRSLEERKRSSEGRRTTVRWRCRDGAELQTEVTSSRIQDAEGRAVGFLGMFTDVTARLKAQAERERLLEQHRRQREFLQKLVENSPAAIAVLEGPEHRCVFANSAFTAAANATLVDEHGCASIDQVYCTAKSVSLLERPVPLAGGAGTGYWNIDYVPLMGTDGKPESVLVIGRDVTDLVSARKRAEVFAAEAKRRAREAEEGRKAVDDLTARFRRLIDGGFIGIAVADPDRIVEANDAFLNMLGYTRQEFEVINWQDITVPEYLHLDYRGMEDLYKTGVCKPFEKEFIRKDGTRLPVLIGASLLSLPPEPQWVAFILDLTERKRIEAQFREAQKMESIAVLAGGIAHDFNNILTGILGNASLLLESMHPFDADRVYLEGLISAGERAADLTRQLLAYAGKGRFVLSRLDLSTEVSGMLGLLRASLPATARIETELPPGLPDIEADSGQIQQVLMNLVLNAAEALEGRPGQIHIRTFARAVEEMGGGGLSPGIYAALEVRDTGCGMDAATLERIYEPFFTTKFTGRGLGLPAVHGIVKAQKGVIQVSSEPGKGSVFTLFFPAAHAEAPRRVEWAGAAEPANPRRPEIVLVVDDEESVRQVAQAALERHGYTVLLANDGPDAIEVFRQMHDRISVIVLDATMPRMSGEETLREIKRIRPDVGVLLSSGYSHQEAERRFRGHELAGFIGKPYTAAALAEKVKAVCHCQR